MAEVAGSNPAEPIVLFRFGEKFVSDDKEDELATSEELPTSAKCDEKMMCNTTAA